MIITVFGNDSDKYDQIALLVADLIKKSRPDLKFISADPTENLEPPSDPWIIMDSAIGIDHVTLIESLDDLEFVKGSSVHDFDVYMELRLKAKIQKLPQLKIILIPQGDDPVHASSHVTEILANLD